MFILVNKYIKFQKIIFDNIPRVHFLVFLKFNDLKMKTKRVNLLLTQNLQEFIKFEHIIFDKIHNIIIHCYCIVRTQ